MKKKTRRLTLNRETLHHLGFVSAAASAETICGYTCVRQCQLVPSVDYCDTGVACASNGLPGCNSGFCESQVINGCASAIGC